jgi:hypothetical protein
MQAIQTYGPDNPLAGLPQMRNTLADLMATSGVRNVDRYFLPEQPAQPAQAPQGDQQQPQSDPAQAMVQAETIKAQAKIAVDMQRLQLDAMKAQMQDDRERDRMMQDMEIAMAQIAGKYGIALDTARIKAEQAMNGPAAQPQMQPQMPPQGPEGGGMM